MNKFLSAIAVISTTFFCAGPLHAQQEQQVRAEIQKKLGTNVKVKSVTPAPVSGLYEVLVGNDTVSYTHLTLPTTSRV